MCAVLQAEQLFNLTIFKMFYFNCVVHWWHTNSIGTKKQKQQMYTENHLKLLTVLTFVVKAVEKKEKNKYWNIAIFFIRSANCFKIIKPYYFPKSGQ